MNPGDGLPGRIAAPNGTNRSMSPSLSAWRPPKDRPRGAGIGRGYLISETTLVGEIGLASSKS